MKDFPPIIEPSEIISDRAGTIKEESSAPNPWRRFLARFVDYSLWLSLLGLLRGSMGKVGPPTKSLVPWEFLAWLPIEIFLLIFLGTTVGKYFLKIEIRQGRRRKLSLITACRRSFSVWFRGLGMMIPLLNCVCLLLAYYRLITTRATSWDREEGIVLFFRPVGQWRIVASALFSSIALFLYYR